METSQKHSEKRRVRSKKRKRQKDVNLLKRVDLSPSRNLGILKQPSRKENRIKRITKRCLNSVIQDLYKQQILIDPSLNRLETTACNPQNQTIDLCDADNSVEEAFPSVFVNQSTVRPKKEVVIDLCRGLPDQSEVIDLTETPRPPLVDCSGSSNHEPTVIDITEEETKEQKNGVMENDDILVLGTFSGTSNQSKECKILPSFIPLTSTKTNFNNLIKCSEKLKRKYLWKKSVLDKIGNKRVSQCSNDFSRKKSPFKVARIGENIYADSPVTYPSSGLRPIIIDGSNVAFVRSSCNFSCRRLEICINYFKEKGHKVTAFVPQFRLNNHKSDNPELLRKLEKQGDVILTPSKKVDGRNIVPYDDRFIVQTAVLKGGIIVTRDNYNDLLRENPAWAETIKYRTLAFTWVDDVLMFPKDPLGEYGPSLEDFLRFH